MGKVVYWWYGDIWDKVVYLNWWLGKLLTGGVGRYRVGGYE